MEQGGLHAVQVELGITAVTEEDALAVLVLPAHAAALPGRVRPAHSFGLCLGRLTAVMSTQQQTLPPLSRDTLQPSQGEYGLCMQLCLGLCFRLYHLSSLQQTLSSCKG